MLTPRPEAALGGKKSLLSTWPRFEQETLLFSFSTPQTCNHILGDVPRQAQLIFGQT